MRDTLYNLTAQPSVLYLLLVLLSIALVIAVFVYNRFLMISKQKQVIALQNENKTVLLREIHHRVKNNLQIISSLIELQIDKPDVDLYFAMREVQTKMRTIAIAHQMMYEEMELKNVELQTYFENMVYTTLEILGSTNVVEQKINMNCHDLDPEILISLALAVNEMLINTIKHVLPYVDRCQVDLACSLNNGQLHFTYSDNGPGQAAEKKGRLAGTGIRLIHQLARQMNAKLMVEMQNDGKVSYLLIFDDKMTTMNKA